MHQALVAAPIQVGSSLPEQPHFYRGAHTQSFFRLTAADDKSSTPRADAPFPGLETLFQPSK